MQLNTWSNLTNNKDYDYAFEEILHYCYTMEMDGAQRPALSLVLVGTALAVMDYTDHLDFTRNLNSDPEKNRINRLGNFFEYLRDYAAKRTALLGEEDKLIERKLAKYQATRTTVKVMEGRGINPDRQGHMDIDEVGCLVEALQENLIVQGIERLPLARACIDAAFIYAKLCQDDSYEKLCLYLSHDDSTVTAQEDFSEAQNIFGPQKKIKKIDLGDKRMEKLLGEEFDIYRCATIH